MGDIPTDKGTDPMTPEALARAASIAAATDQVHAAPVRSLGGRRISFLAWGIAGLAGVALWALIIRLA